MQLTVYHRDCFYMANPTVYQPPVNKLLTFGDIRAMNGWSDYIKEIGLNSQHIPDLINMAVDKELNEADSNSLRASAPIHAWRALGQLGSGDAVKPLTNLFHELQDNEWLSEEMPKVFGMIGKTAISELGVYLAEKSHPVFSRITATNSLEEIAKHHQESAKNCIEVLTKQLKLFLENPEELNGFIIASLIQLQAVESAPIIKAAFLADVVPEDITGDWEEVREILNIDDVIEWKLISEDNLGLKPVNLEVENQDIKYQDIKQPEIPSTTLENIPETKPVEIEETPDMEQQANVLNMLTEEARRKANVEAMVNNYFLAKNNLIEVDNTDNNRTYASSTKSWRSWLLGG
jgi:hypothetical protein